MTLGRKTETYRFEDIGANSHETRARHCFAENAETKMQGKARLAETSKRQRLFAGRCDRELFSPAHADQR
jgi:hypothetical protein